MTQPAPVRLLEATSDAGPELSAALRRARADGPNAAQLERLMSGVLAQLPASQAAQVASKPPVSGVGASRWLWLIVIGIGATALLWAVRASHPASAPVARPNATVAKAANPVAQEQAPAPAPAATMAESLPVAPARNAVPAARPAAPPPRVHRTRAANQDPGAEIALLQQARRALASAPDQALALTQSHLRLFPDGVFREEREALAIEALLALGRRDEAKSRAHALVQRYPQSAYRRRIERLLAGGADSERAP